MGSPGWKRGRPLERRTEKKGVGRAKRGKRMKVPATTNVRREADAGFQKRERNLNKETYRSEKIDW